MTGCVCHKTRQHRLLYLIVVDSFVSLIKLSEFMLSWSFSFLLLRLCFLYRTLSKGCLCVWWWLVFSLPPPYFSLIVLLFWFFFCFISCYTTCSSLVIECVFVVFFSFLSFFSFCLYFCIWRFNKIWYHWVAFSTIVTVLIVTVSLYSAYCAQIYTKQDLKEKSGKIKEIKKLLK